MGEEVALKVVRMFKLDGDSKVKAFADIAVGEYVVKGVKVIQGRKGLFLSMPQDKSKDGKWYNTFYPTTTEARMSLSELVLAAYEA
jgi:stage V sporulation protein G